MLRELANGVYLEDGFAGGNVGLLLSERGALLVDTPMLPPEARQWQLSLMQMNVGEIYAIVNTDYHPEHLIGNASFMPVRTFGHELSARPIARYRRSALEPLSALYRDSDPTLADEILQVEIRLPQLSVSDRVTLHLGDRRVQVLHMEGHTPASLGVYLPEERILFAGDNIVNNEHPTMYDASSLAWLDTLELIRGMGVDLIVPGQGEVCGKEAIHPMRDYIVEMRRRITELFEEGAARRECVKKVGMLDWFPIPDGEATRIKWRRRRNVERLYTEIRIAHRGRR